MTTTGKTDIRSKEEPYQILVVDSNKVFAGFVKEVLTNHLCNAKVDIAVNIWEVKRKLAARNYNFVIADISTAIDASEMASEFEKLQTPVCYWSTGNPTAVKHLQGEDYSTKKPSSLEELKQLIPTMVKTGGTPDGDF